MPHENEYDVLGQPMPSTSDNSASVIPPFNPGYTFDFSTVPVELIEDVKAGNKELIQQDMQGHEARVCLILDVSASMQNPNQFFQDASKGNQVQTLINKALALAFLFDDNQTVEVFPFGDQAFDPLILNRDNFKHATQLIMDKIGGQLRTSTNYADPVRAIRNYYLKDQGERHQPQTSSEPPVFAIFITDGEPNSKLTEAENQFISASHQAIFFKFIALKGKQADLEFDYLSKIDNHAVKKNTDDNESNLFFIDNSDLLILDNPNELTMEKLIYEYRPWLIEARQKGLLVHDPKVKMMDIKGEGRTVSNNQTTFPESYKEITETISGDLLKAKKILTDYTKDNSLIGRLVHGHWNRNHVDEVHKIVMCINADQEGAIKTVKDLLTALNNITLKNKDGSLSRRIQFISENFDNSSEPGLSYSLNT